AEPEGSGQLAERLLIALDVHQNIVRLVDFGDGIGELAPAPVLETVQAAFARGNHALVALDHGGHLLALIGMDQEYDLVVPHVSSLRISVSRPSRGLRGAARRRRRGFGPGRRPTAGTACAGARRIHNCPGNFRLLSESRGYRPLAHRLV